MLIPISWLKDFVDIKIPLKELMWKMTEAGLTCESYKNIDGEIVLDVEVTPNRSDWMSMLGIAREIAAITKSKLKYPIPKLKLEKPKTFLEIKIKPNYAIVPRITSVVIKNVTVKPSPDWLQKRILQIGLRPINNLVDITNFCLWIYGNSLHVFDYDKIRDNKMVVESAKGGEPFRSLDGIDYTLPKNAIIIKDKGRVIDLVPLKGGENTAVSNPTKNVLLHSIICNPTAVRRVSQALKLRSDSSTIAERGMDPNGTITALTHALILILKLAGGEAASEILDHKEHEFKPWSLDLNLMKLEKVLGMKITSKEVVDILNRLNLSPKPKKNKITCAIPTYRGDLKIEEDLIEEVARIHGYNNFPKSLPTATTPSQKIPYYFDDKLHLYLKNLLAALGYSEVMNYSLISKNIVNLSRLDLSSHIRILNPVSSEYEFMRTSLIPGLLSALKLNLDNNVKIFESGKVYLGEIGKTQEPYKLAGVSKNETFLNLKGLIDLLFYRLNILGVEIRETAIRKSLWHPFKSGVIEIGDSTLGRFGEIHPEVLKKFGIDDQINGFELDISLLQEFSREPIFKPIPKYPPQIEDLTISFPLGTKIGEVLRDMKKSNIFISDINLASTYKDFYTFRIYYQNPEKTLTDKEVKKIREKLTDFVAKKFGGIVKN